VILAVMATLAKQERVKRSERTKAGLARVKAAGTRLGRPAVVNSQKTSEIVRLGYHCGLSRPAWAFHQARFTGWPRSNCSINVLPKAPLSPFDWRGFFLALAVPETNVFDASFYVKNIRSKPSGWVIDRTAPCGARALSRPRGVPHCLALAAPGALGPVWSPLARGLRGFSIPSPYTYFLR
jgi:hypothetical protein